MNRPNLPPELAAVFTQDHVEFFMLVKLDFDTTPVYICGADFDVTYDGQLWSSLRGLGSLDPIVESSSEIPGLSLTLSGVPFESIVHAQTEAYRGRKVTVLWAFFDGDNLRVDPSNWQGYMDIPVITRGQETCTIQVTAENRMIDWQRQRGLLFNHADQQRIDPTDNFFLGIEGMVEQEITLFKAENYAGGGIGFVGGGGSGDPIPDNGAEYNVDIINAYREYYNRRPDIGGYNSFAQSGLYGSALMIAILAASAPSGGDFDVAVSRGWDPTNPTAHYFPSVLHPDTNEDGWVGLPDGEGGG